MSLRRLPPFSPPWQRCSPRSCSTSPLAIWAGIRAASRPRHGADRPAFRDRRGVRARVLPAISVVAERVRVGNADWGSQPQMVELGRLSARIGLWSLVSGPVDVSLEVERPFGPPRNGPRRQRQLGSRRCGRARGGRGADSSAGAGAPGPPERQARQPADHVSRARQAGPGSAHRDVEHRPGSAGLLALSGKGSLNELPATVSGEPDPSMRSSPARTSAWRSRPRSETCGST